VTPWAVPLEHVTKNLYLEGPFGGRFFLDIFSIISISGTVIGLLAFAIIAIKHRRNAYQKFLFLLFVFSLTYNSFLTFLAVSGFLLDYPHFYRTASPLFYCVPISLYLLGKAIGQKQVRPTRYDLLFFIIPLIHIAELLPFYLKDAAYKLMYLENLQASPDIMVFSHVSLFSNALHYIFQLGLGVVLMALTFTRTLKYRKDASRASRRRKLVWINWISLFLGICFAVLLLLLVTDTQAFHSYLYGSSLLMMALLIIFLGLFLEPHVLYGTTISRTARSKAGRRNEENLQLKPEEEHFRQVLEKYFREERGFLKPTFRQSDLAAHLGLSKNTLSYLINKVFQMNFNQLLNEKRIEVALRNLENTRWQHLSLEGIAHEVGFKSRTTFNKAFKLKTGCTPSKYKAA
jgi:AraC-like DNA-binding protein